MEAKYVTYINNVRERGRRSACISLRIDELPKKEKTVKKPHETQTLFLFVRGLNRPARLLSESCAKVKKLAYVCSKIYIREKINLHTTEKLFPYVRSQILIKDEVDIYLCDHKNRKINHYINRIKNMSQCEEPQKNSSLITLSPLVFMITDRMEQSEQNEKKKLNTPKDNIFPKRMEVKNNLNKASSRLCC